MSSTLTGYGPRHRLVFDGDGEKFEVWEAKFRGYLTTKELDGVLQEGSMPEASENKQVYAELIQLLDDRSIALILRDAADKGKEALQILRNYYLGASKPRVISLYKKLSTLRLGGDEQLVDYIIRAEAVTAALKKAGEAVSDSMTMAMVLSGLPQAYDTFSTVVEQREKEMTFQEFKKALMNYEESGKLRSSREEESVMNTSRFPLKCYECHQPGHKSFQCPQRAQQNRRWCNKCKSNTHNTHQCRKKNATTANTVSSEGDQAPRGEDSDEGDNLHNFAFQASTQSLRGNKASTSTLLVDSGASVHIVTDKTKFIRFDRDFEPNKQVMQLAGGSRQTGDVLGRGDASVMLYDINGKLREMVMKNTLYIPSYKFDIFSVAAATRKGVCVNFEPNHAELVTPDGSVFNVKRQGNLYFINNVESVQVNGAHTAEEWHKILGHCNFKDIIKLEKAVEGMHISGEKERVHCEACTLGKMSKSTNRKPDKRATRNLDLVHSDLAGPMNVVGKGGFKYAITFVDDHSGAFMVYLMKEKSDTVSATEKFLADSAPYGSVKRLRTDNGGEYISKKFKSLMVKHKIKQEYSAPHSPHQNGTAERSWRTMCEMARCLLLEADLPKMMWPYAMKASAYIRNRCFNPRTGKTPVEVLTGSKPNLSNMHIFGTVCYSYIQNCKKLDARCERGVFVGYDGQSPAYLVYLPEKREVRRVRCVKFTDRFEVEMPKILGYESDNDYDMHCPSKPLCRQPAKNYPDQVKCESKTNGTNTDEGYARQNPPRVRNTPSYLKDYVLERDDDDENDMLAGFTIHYCHKVCETPNTYVEAIHSPDSQLWQKAMQEEIDALTESDTFELIELPEGRSLVGSKWVYSVKDDPHNGERHKARFVARGFSQIYGVDYHETFSPTARLTSLRMLLQLAVQENLQIHQMDVKTAYLNADIDCDIYLEQPEGFVKTNEKGDKLVCKLKKSLYGLKQSGRNWYNLLHGSLVEEGLVQSQSDHCVYHRIDEDSTVLILFWVDDIIIAASDAEVLNSIKTGDLQRTGVVLRVTVLS
ncbi:hypothetical protein Pcinc_014947 [Petrolisthes cinctipes]|uniref:Retrovirus-related Pol poly from transposon TNT 1-94 n=1 Tax=Petrolisthes cinctipes TaxID=88211 RepID=A0AAE1FVV8_PETCI|nr:hypothetical protein Pcinc_014947 [Petrolisthes cinctipes]